MYLVDSLLDTIATGDVCSIGMLMVLLAMTGTMVVQRHPKLNTLARRTAAASFAVFLTIHVVRHGIGSADDMISTLCICASAVGITYGIAAILLRTAVAVWESMYLPVRSLVSLRRRRKERIRSAAMSERQRAERREAERRRAIANTQQAEEERRREQRQAEGDRRRASARAELEREYVGAGARLREQFAPDEFERYMTQHMGDNHPSTAVEERARQLIVTFDKLVGEPAARGNDLTLETLASWFVDQKGRIDGLPLDQRIKERLHAGINVRYAELTEQIIQELQP